MRQTLSARWTFPRQLGGRIILAAFGMPLLFADLLATKTYPVLILSMDLTLGEAFQVRAIFQVSSLYRF